MASDALQGENATETDFQRGLTVSIACTQMFNRLCEKVIGVALLCFFDLLPRKGRSDNNRASSKQSKDSLEPFEFQ